MISKDKKILLYEKNLKKISRRTGKKLAQESNGNDLGDSTSTVDDNTDPQLETEEIPTNTLGQKGRLTYLIIKRSSNWDETV